MSDSDIADFVMGDTEIVARNPRRADESEEQWIKRLRHLKAVAMVQAEIDAGRLVRIGDGRLVGREHLH